MHHNIFFAAQLFHYFLTFFYGLVASSDNVRKNEHCQGILHIWILVGQWLAVPSAGVDGGYLDIS